MRLRACIMVCALLGSPLVVQAEYIEITQPADGSVWRPCAPTQVLWESDINPAEGEVLEVDWNTWSRPPWYSLGTTPNDGTQEWTGPRPCWTEHSVIPIRHEVRVTYLPDPSIVDVITFWTFQSVVQGPYTLCIDFSGTASSYEQIVNRADPPLYVSFDAYVAIIEPVSQGSGGFRNVSFELDVSPAGVLAPPSFENLLPGDLAIGSWDTGITLSSPECVQSGGEVVYIARLGLFYLGGACDILIRDHPEFPRWVVNCADPGEVAEYVVGNHGGVWKEPASTPVKATSWGAIKALYRE